MSSPDGDEGEEQTERAAPAAAGPTEEPAPAEVPGEPPTEEGAPEPAPPAKREVRIRSEDAKAAVEMWTTVGQVAAAVAASAGFVYLIGGIVMWLRFREADLPADQAVSLMSRQQLLVVGLRLMVLPALATGVLAWMATSRTSPRDPAVDEPWHKTLRRRVREVSMRHRVGVALLAALLLVLELGLPATWASLGWAAAAAMVIGVRLHQIRHPERHPKPRLTMALVAVAAAGLVSLARQLDQPVQLLSADVALDDGSSRGGVFVSASGDDVFLGDTAMHKIVALPRTHVTSVTVGPPAERAPRPSLLSQILGSNDFSITPFEWWCNGERYSWGELGALCRTQLQLIDASRVLDDEHPSYAPVKVRCPPRATEGCRGSLRLVSRKVYRSGPASLPKHVTIGPVPLHTADVKAGDTIPPGKTGYVCPQVSGNTRGLLRNVAADGDDQPTPTVQFQLIVSSDAAGNDVVRRTNYALTIPPPGEAIRPNQSDCSTLHAR